MARERVTGSVSDRLGDIGGPLSPGSHTFELRPQLAERWKSEALLKVQPSRGAIDTARSAIQGEAMIAESSAPPTPVHSPAGERAGALATIGFLCSAIGLGLLLGTGPVGFVIAPFGVLLGLFAIATGRAGRRRGLALAAIVIGTIVTLLSLAVILGSQEI
jgi:hypothetical protein